MYLIFYVLTIQFREKKSIKKCSVADDKFRLYFADRSQVVGAKMQVL